MLNPRLAKYAERLREVIADGNALLQKTRRSDMGEFVDDGIALSAWSSKSNQILDLIFGSESTYVARFRSAVGQSSYRGTTERGIGCLQAALRLHQ